MRKKILDLLSGEKIDKQPAFSGLIHITEYQDLTCLIDSVVNQIRCVDNDVSQLNFFGDMSGLKIHTKRSFKIYRYWCKINSDNLHLVNNGVQSHDT